MPLSPADLTQLGDAPIAILSTAFPGIYLRADCEGASTTSPGGTVNCVYCPSNSVDPQARFKVRPQADGSYCLESAVFANYFLRMDGTGVPAASRAGAVNCLYGIVDATQKFSAHIQADGSFCFESVAFPGIYLCMNGTGVTAATGPGGTVNCQANGNGSAIAMFDLYMIDQYINFAVQKQEQTNWCWDAVTVSVAAYYNSNNAWTQCSLANTTFGRNDCCVAAGQTSPCNWGQWPDGPLATVGYFTQKLTNALTPAQLGAQLAKSAPVVCNITWAQGGGHIVALRGHSTIAGTDHVSVGDPWNGDSDQMYSTFLNAYQGSGTWDTTYPTK